MGAHYGLRPVDRPPVRDRRSGATRKSKLVREIEKAAETPDQWFRVVDYDSPTSAYSARKRLNQRDWPWPVVFWVYVEGETSTLYAKVMSLPEGTPGTPSDPPDTMNQTNNEGA